jgi:hypothetical protein
MRDYNQQAMQLLLPLLREKIPVLMVGAGSSMLVGYESWNGLVNQMALELASALQKPDGASASEFAEIIKEFLQQDKRIDDYYNFLERVCNPRNKPRPYDPMHIALVKLGFSGVATTNYDPVLEQAISKAFESDIGSFRCEEVDLCGPRPHAVSDFIEELTERKKLSLVLHFHGYYRNPVGIILTESDYRKKYGIDPQFDQDGKPILKSLETLHKKVLYSLLLHHRFFFTGFSLSDKFFMHVLSIVQDDFQMGTTPRHFATMAFRSEDDRERQRYQLERQGVKPLFYYVPPPKEGEQEDHSDLKALIFELENTLGTNQKENRFEGVSKDWKELLNEMRER